jgi:hypothetical protein
MTLLDTVFNALFNVIPYSFWVSCIAANFIVQFLYIFISHWDLV